MGTIKNHASMQTQTKQNLVGIIQDSGSKLLQNIESNTRRIQNQPFRTWHHVVSEFNQKITTGSQRASNTTF